MYINRQIKGDALPCVAHAERPDALGDIHHPGVAGVIWHRKPETGFQDWMDALDPEQLPSTRIILQPDAIAEAVTMACNAAGTPDCAHRQHLIEDVSELGTAYAQVMETPYVRMRLDVVTGNACRRFHLDAITARLICTYRGQGTQYGIGINGADPENPMQVPTGSPFMLRGSLWPETPKSGLLHRSPPIEGTGETRLLLVLDPIADPQAEEEF